MYNTLLNVVYNKRLYAAIAISKPGNLQASRPYSFRVLQTLVKTGAWGVRTLRHGVVRGAASVTPRATSSGNLYVYLWGLSQDEFRVRPGSKFVIDLYRVYLQAARFACLYF